VTTLTKSNEPSGPLGKFQKSWGPTIWNFIVSYALIGAATILLIIAVVLALMDRVASGSLVATLFVVLALFHFLPQMESFKAFGVEAKWRERLREADELLRKLRQSTLASAQHTYHILGWGSRIGGLRARAKRDLADQIDAALKDLDVPSGELTRLKRDYLFFAQYDLFDRFDKVVGLNIATNIRKATQRINELGQDKSNEEVKELTQKLSKLRQSRPRPDLMEDLPVVDFHEYCHARIPVDGLPVQDATILAGFADKVASMWEACRKTERVPDDAVELMDQSDPSAFYRNLFNEEPAS
jgi:hypothetical protein